MERIHKCWYECTTVHVHVNDFLDWQLIVVQDDIYQQEYIKKSLAVLGRLRDMYILLVTDVGYL